MTWVNDRGSEKVNGPEGFMVGAAVAVVVGPPLVGLLLWAFVVLVWGNPVPFVLVVGLLVILAIVVAAFVRQTSDSGQPRAADS